MKSNKPSQDHTQKLAIASQPPANASYNPREIDLTPSADEVARRAYLSYGNQLSLPEDEVQHWLEAESQLLEERNPVWAYGLR